MAAIIEKISLYQNMHFGVRHKSRSSIKLVAKVTFVIKCGTLNLQLVRKIITNFIQIFTNKKEEEETISSLTILCFQISHAKFYWIITFFKPCVCGWPINNNMKKSLFLSLSFHELKMINSNVISTLSLSLY